MNLYLNHLNTPNKIEKTKLQANDQSEQKNFNVYVLDLFKYKTEDIDGDSLPDVSHGELTVAMLKNNNPKIQVKTKDCSKINDPNAYDSNKLLANLEKIYKSAENGEKIDGINISLSCNIDYEEINSAKNLKKEDIITPENVNEKTSLIKDRLYHSADSRNNQACKIIKMIEKIAQKNIPVVIAAGNHFNSFNALGLAKGATVIGGTHKNTKCSLLSINNTVDDWEEAIKFSKPIKRANDKIVGYDVTNNGKLDFFVEEMSSQSGEKKDSTLFGGTSFAAPCYLNKILLYKLSNTTKE